MQLVHLSLVRVTKKTFEKTLLPIVNINFDSILIPLPATLEEKVEKTCLDVFQKKEHTNNQHPQCFAYPFCVATGSHLQL